MLKILHVSKYPARQGGMDALLRLHRSNEDRTLGLLAHADGESIGFNPILPFSLQRKALRNMGLESRACDVSLYYNCWGTDFLSAYEAAPLRVGYLHNHFPNFDVYIRYFAPFLDGFLTVNPATTKRLRGLLRGTHREGNIQTVPLPVTPPEPLPRVERTRTIGIVGRINYEQKGLDRLPALAEVLAKELPDFQIEVLGQGEKLQELRERTLALGNVQFTPWLSGEDYWKKLLSWKIVLFLSRYEGLPIALLEALRAGCGAVYPDFHDGDTQGLPLSLYPEGDMGAANRAIHCALGARPQALPHVTSQSDYLKILREQVGEIRPRERAEITSYAGRKWLNSVRYNAFYKALTLGKM